jgi:hypothetical protein
MCASSSRRIDADCRYAVRNEVEEYDEAGEDGDDVEVTALLTGLLAKELLAHARIMPWRSLGLPRFRLYCLNDEMDRVVIQFRGGDQSGPLLAVLLNPGRATDEAFDSLGRQGSEVEVDSDRGRFRHSKVSVRRWSGVLGSTDGTNRPRAPRPGPRFLPGAVRSPHP